MRTRYWLILLIASFALGAGADYKINALQKRKLALIEEKTRQEAAKQEAIKQETAKQERFAAIETVVSDPIKTIPELVASQIQSGNTTCPEDDALSYEACLLYQGTLGTWHRVGMADECPAVIGDNQQTDYSTPTQNKKFTPEDALRATKSNCFNYLYAIGVANLTPVLVSTSNRTFQLATGHRFPEPGSNAHLCVEARHGICGNHAAVGQALFEKAGIESRTVEFYYSDDIQRLSHIIVETYIGGDWRPIDTTYGAYWPNNENGQPFKLMTTDELLSNKANRANPVRNEALLPYGFYSSFAKPHYFDYLDASADIVRGNQKTISLAMNNKKAKEVFTNIPNFIGDNKADNEFNPLTYRLISNKSKYRLTLTTAGSAFSSNGPVFICVDKLCEKYSSAKAEYVFTVEDPSMLYLETGMDVAYIVMKSLDWEVLQQ